MAINEEKLEKARMIAQKKMGFIRHIFVYIMVIALLAVINNVTYPGYQWWLWPALGWGIGIIAHMVTLYEGGRLEKKLIMRELERMEDEQ